MNITYWTGYSKKKNSTARPTSGTDATVTLKDDCSILNPVFDCAGVPDNVNYIYVSDFGRYYFVSDVVHITADRIQIHCSVDVLASYKSQIGSYNAYVEYAASSDEIKITDPRNKPLLTFEEKHTPLFDLGAAGFSTNGCFVLALAGGDGGVTYYVMSAQAMKDFYNQVLDDSFWTSIQNAFFHLDDAVLSCKWLPYTPAGVQESIYICGQPTYVDGFRITSRLATIAEASYDIAYYSDTLGYGTNYLDFEPYTTGVLYLPYVGSVPLDLGVVSKSKQIRIKIAIDNYTGDIVYKLSNESGDFISSYQGNCSINVPLSSKSNNALGAAGGGISLIGGIVATAAAIATEGGSAAIMAGVGAAVGGASALAQSLSVHTQVNGSVSSAVATELSTKIIATVITRVPAETDLRAFRYISGMPYFQAAQISSLSGYVKCSGASVTIPGYESEKDAVNGYLNSGFFYE